MGKESDKASVSRRRKHKFRMRRRARRAFSDWNKAERCADHLKVCSCWMCGNPRKYAKSKERFSWQERRQFPDNGLSGVSPNGITPPHGERLGLE